MQIDDVEGRDVVGEAFEEVLPVALFPEAESFHFGARVAHWCETIRGTLEIVVDEFHHVCSDDLVRIDEDHLVKRKWKEDVQKQDLVTPDLALFLGLGTEPMWPFKRDQFVFETILCCDVREKLFE